MNRRFWIYKCKLTLGLLLFTGVLASVVAAGAEPLAPRSSANTNLAAWPRHSLQVEQAWQLNLPQGREFDASALLLTAGGELLTIDNLATTLYRIPYSGKTNSIDLIPLTDCFTPAQLQKFRSEKKGFYDFEGIAQDDEGRLYLCEENSRWILRCDAKSQTVERLKIDWSPVAKYFTPFDPNASFEGIAIGGGKLYVANERMLGRIITVDLQTLRIVDDFLVDPSGKSTTDVQYSDLSWFEGHLYLLLRDHRCVVKIDPQSHHILAEYSFLELERHPEYAYERLYSTGNMEGLAVDRDHIWLVTDNNGLGRIKYPKDIRPTLFKCPRPDQPKN